MHRLLLVERVRVHLQHLLLIRRVAVNLLLLSPLFLLNLLI